MNDILEMYRGDKKQTGFTKHYMTLFSMVEGLEAKQTFEFGTGISTKMIMKAHEITGGYHYSNDIRDFVDTGLTQDFQDKYFDQYKFMQGDSRLVKIPEVAYDFVLHDGSHVPGIVKKDIEKILPYMKVNSILAVHDTVKPNDSLMHAAIAATKDIEVERLTLPYGYGLTLFRILHDFGNGTVAPTWIKH